jgi:hypothetical protein
MMASSIRWQESQDDNTEHLWLALNRESLCAAHKESPAEEHSSAMN